MALYGLLSVHSSYGSSLQIHGPPALGFPRISEETKPPRRRQPAPKCPIHSLLSANFITSQQWTNHKQCCSITTLTARYRAYRYDWLGIPMETSLLSTLVSFQDEARVQGRRLTTLQYQAPSHVAHTVASVLDTTQQPHHFRAHRESWLHLLEY